MKNIREINIGFNHNFQVTCEEHKHIGNLPCPWENCKKGIPENEFLDITHKGFGENAQGFTTHYKRRKWTSLDGYERFTWDSQNTPAIYRADTILREENLRTGTQEVDYSNHTIYHYTSMQGLHGIINSNSLWLTDFQYMNDSQEISHGIKLAKSILAKLEDSKRYTDKKNYFKIWKNFVETGIDRRICISCFSIDNGDSLSQWRGYGNMGGGISIGFKVSDWKFWNKDLTTLNNVIYDIEEQQKILSNFFHIYLTVLDWDKDKNMTNINGKKIKPHKPEELKSYFISQIYKQIINFKHPSFSDEMEARWVFQEDKGFLKDMGIKSLKKNFRTIANKLIPYISSNDLPNIGREINGTTKLPISEIVVGPQKDSDLVINGIKEFLEEYGYSNIKIRKSSIPFRVH